MKLNYSSLKDNDEFVLTNFSCHPSQKLLNEIGLFKILWNKGTTVTITVDGYNIELHENEMIFCTY